MDAKHKKQSLDMSAAGGTRDWGFRATGSLEQWHTNGSQKSSQLFMRSDFEKAQKKSSRSAKHVQA